MLPRGVLAAHRGLAWRKRCFETVGGPTAAAGCGPVTDGRPQFKVSVEDLCSFVGIGEASTGSAASASSRPRRMTLHAALRELDAEELGKLAKLRAPLGVSGASRVVDAAPELAEALLEELADRKHVPLIHSVRLVEAAVALGAAEAAAECLPPLLRRVAVSKRGSRLVPSVLFVIKHLHQHLGPEAVRPIAHEILPVFGALFKDLYGGRRVGAAPSA